MPDAIEVRKVPIHSVADASELTKLVEAGVMDASRVIAIIGKTEGNGGVNDYTRIIADRAFREALVAAGAPAEQVKEVPIVWSGGTDGVISPHATIFATTDAEPSDEPRLTVGFAMSDQLLPEDIGRTPMVEKVAAAVKRGHGAGRHHRPGRRPLRADQDAAADHPHHPRRQVARQDGVDRGDPLVDGPLQRLHRARHRGRPRRDRDADRRRRDAQPVALLLGRLVLLGRRARPGAGGRGGQRDGRRAGGTGSGTR